jgi:hypothetical protein
MCESGDSTIGQFPCSIRGSIMASDTLEACPSKIWRNMASDSFNRKHELQKTENYLFCFI